MKHVPCAYDDDDYRVYFFEIFRRTLVNLPVRQKMMCQIQNHDVIIDGTVGAARLVSGGIEVNEWLALNTRICAIVHVGLSLHTIT